MARHSDSRSVDRREFLKTIAAAGIGASLFGCGGSLGTLRPRLDLIIRGGSVIDGTGLEPFAADIGIRDGRIAAIGDLAEASAGRVIDATGKIVCPGFVDIHSHVDNNVLRRPYSESKVRQGVTTEVVGADGGSWGPISETAREQGNESFKKEFGIDRPREIAGYLALVEQRRPAQNILTLVGLGTVRESVVGMDNRPASPDEMRLMKKELQLAIEQGCWGVSSGLEYTPGSFASQEELAELMRSVPAHSRMYSTHIRNEDNKLLEAIDEAINICRASGARLQVAHLKASYRVNWHKQARALEMLQEAGDQGMEVHADRYPYIAYATTLAALFPLWSRDGGTGRFLDRLRNTEDMGKIREEVLNKVAGLGSWESVMVSSTRREEHRKYPGKTVMALAGELSADPFEFVVDLMLKEEGSVGMVGFGMNEEGTEMVLRWNNTIVSSDAGASWPEATSRPHPRAYGTFPRAIAHYQRERNITTLPDMIRKMTSLPAGKIGIADRGILREGNWADVVVFDYERIQDKATFVDPHQYPEGIPYVLVNGIPVVDGDRQTKELPGKVLRRT